MVRLDVLRMPSQENRQDYWEARGVANYPQPAVDGVSHPLRCITPHAAARRKQRNLALCRMRL